MVDKAYSLLFHMALYCILHHSAFVTHVLTEPVYYIQNHPITLKTDFGIWSFLYVSLCFLTLCTSFESFKGISVWESILNELVCVPVLIKMILYTCFSMKMMHKQQFECGVHLLYTMRWSKITFFNSQ